MSGDADHEPESEHEREPKPDHEPAPEHERRTGADGTAPKPESNDNDEGTPTPEDIVEWLVEGEVLTEAEPDVLVTTDDYEATRGVYHDTYTTVPEGTFHESIAEVFGLADAAAAAERIEELGVTREEFVAYLAVDSHLERSPSPATLARMARVVCEVEPGTPVPDAVVELHDESYPEFVEAHDRAIVTVWKRHCAPCEAMKEELDAVLAAVPEGVAVGGLDGERCADFRRATGIDAAPALALFEDGAFQEGFTGRATPEKIAAACTDVYEHTDGG